MTTYLPFRCRSWQAVEAIGAESIICVTDAGIQSIPLINPDSIIQVMESQKQALTISPKPVQAPVSQ